MPNSTPGPWMIADDNVTVIRMMDDDYEAIVADCEASLIIRNEQREANARLISKAPEMVELLKRCKRNLDEEVDPGFATRDLIRCINSLFAEVEK